MIDHGGGLRRGVRTLASDIGAAGMKHSVRLPGRPAVTQSARTAVAAGVSLWIARAFRLPEAFWAPITTIMITQSSLGAALNVSSGRLVGTVLGVLLGAVVATRFGPRTLVFGVGVFILGLLHALVHADQAAYRFGVVAFAIVLLVPRTEPAWEVALLRFATVALAIVVTLILAVVWPETETAPTPKR